ncbi:MAG: tetratricopeptide repeat protein [Candidatus Neomarinimicrobiota bacterium]|nr:tetratricopeptide repeat protein [Candidatus Neomarinimicrobiota bacterium]
MRNKILIYVLLGIGSPGLAQWTASLKTARMLEKGGNVEGAIAVYEDILNKNPKNRQAIRDLKSIYKKHQKFDDGIIFLRNLLTLQPNDMQSHAELGEFHYLNDQKAEAESVWANALEKFEKNRSFYQIMLSKYGYYGLDGELESMLVNGRNNFDSSFLSYEMGSLYQSKRVYDKAMDEYILNLTYATKWKKPIQRKILNMSDEEDAVLIIEVKLLDATEMHPEIFLETLSDFYFKQKNFDRAINVKKEWAKTGEWNAKSWLKFADDLRKENQFNTSVDAYNFILNRKVPSQIAGKALLGLAQTFKDQIVPEGKTHLIPYFFDQNVYFENPFQVNSSISPKHLQSSLALYDSLLVSLPKSSLLAEAYFRLGEIQYRILQDFDQANALFRSALRNKPDKTIKIETLQRIVDVLIAKGNTAYALEFLDKQMTKNNSPKLEQKRILVHFLTNNPDSTLNLVNDSFMSMNPIDPSFNDLMELKNILTQYHENTSKSLQNEFLHFQNSEKFIRQGKDGDAIQELNYVMEQYPQSKILPLVTLRKALLHFRLNQFEEALALALALEETPFADRGIILAGEIYETKYFETEKAMTSYMRILKEFPNSIFSEPIRYHIRKIQQTES